MERILLLPIVTLKFIKEEYGKCPKYYKTISQSRKNTLFRATFFLLLLYSRSCPGICFYAQFCRTVKHNRCNLSMSLPLWLLLHTAGLGYSLFHWTAQAACFNTLFSHWMLNNELKSSTNYRGGGFIPTSAGKGTKDLLPIARLIRESGYSSALLVCYCVQFRDTWPSHFTISLPWKEQLHSTGVSNLNCSF